MSENIKFDDKKIYTVTFPDFTMIEIEKKTKLELKLLPISNKTLIDTNALI